MCGFQDLISPVLDIGATLTGNPELIPLINAGVSTGEGLASGKGFGSSLLGGAISGAESLAGQEIAGAVGIGNGNTAVNDALGINISPASTGLPDIGGGIQNMFGGSSSASSGSPVTGGTSDSNAAFLSGNTGASGGSAPTFSGSNVGVQAAPTGASLSAPGGDVTNSFSSSDFSSPAGSSGIDKALSSSLSPSSTSGFSGHLGGSAGNGGSFASSASDSSFLSGSSIPSDPVNTMGQGPTVANAAQLGAEKAPSSFSEAISHPSVSNIGKALGDNAGLLVAGAGLGKDIISANSPLPGEKQLKTQAAQLGQLGLQNQGYLNSGTLPPGVQSGITSATQSAIAAIKSKYAAMGMSGSSAEQSDIANAMQQAQTQGANIAMNLLNQGVSETGLSSEIYGKLMQNAMANDQNFSSAFTNLASVVGR